MKQAKFALTAVALLAVIGGALAFKANRQPNTFFKYTTTLIGGQVTGVCKEAVKLDYVTNPAGAIITTYSSALNTLSGTATCTARVAVSPL